VSAVFSRDGDAFVPALESRASWYPDALHGGPVAALFARAVEEAASATEMMVSRLTVDLMRPVPTNPLRVATRVVREGRRIQVIDAMMTEGDTEVARASALRIRVGAVSVPDHPRQPVPAAAESAPAAELRPAGEAWFHTAAIEMREVAGGFFEPGPATAWIRLTMPLWDDAETTPLQRVAAAADFGNGVSRVLDTKRHVFINADLSVHLHRYPAGEWVCLDSRTDIDDTGVGLAQSELFDESGAIGHALQMLYVDTREGFGA